MSSWIYEVAYALFFIFPAYVANAVPVILGGGRAIDGGKTLRDGKPIFGSHKTVRGFAAGLVAGTLTGAVENAALHWVSLGEFSDFVHLLPFQFSISLGFVISFGALIGDLVHSFIKRRVGIREGAPLLIADQLDFVIGAIAFYFLASPSSPPLVTILIIFVITLPLHLLTNILAYVVGVKKTPW